MSTTDNPPALPDLPEQEDSFAPVTESGQVTPSGDVFELSDRFRNWKTYLETLKGLQKDANETIERLEQVLADRMLTQECSPFTRRGLTFYTKEGVRASPRAGCTDAVVAWMNNNGYGDLVGAETKQGVGDKAVVGARLDLRKLSSFVKELIEDSPVGEPPDDLKELLHIHRWPQVGMRKANK